MNEFVFEQKESELTKMLKHVSTPVSIVLGGLVGLSTIFIPKVLYDFGSYSEFNLQFVYLSVSAFILSFIIVIRTDWGLDKSKKEDLMRLLIGALLSFASIFSGIMLGVILEIILGLIADSTSHSLFPIMIIINGIQNLIYIVPAILGALLAGVINWLIGRLK